MWVNLPHLAQVLNMFNYDLTRKVLIAEAWCPAAECEVTQRALRRASERSGAQVPHEEGRLRR